MQIVDNLSTGRQNWDLCCMSCIGVIVWWWWCSMIILYLTQFGICVRCGHLHARTHPWNAQLYRNHQEIMFLRLDAGFFVWMDKSDRSGQQFQSMRAQFGASSIFSHCIYMPSNTYQMCVNVKHTYCCTKNTSTFLSTSCTSCLRNQYAEFIFMCVLIPSIYFLQEKNSIIEHHKLLYKILWFLCCKFF
jgi:hypothetical protein